MLNGATLLSLLAHLSSTVDTTRGRQIPDIQSLAKPKLFKPGLEVPNLKYQIIVSDSNYKNTNFVRVMFLGTQNISNLCPSASNRKTRNELVQCKCIV